MKYSCVVRMHRLHKQTPRFYFCCSCNNFVCLSLLSCHHLNWMHTGIVGMQAIFSCAYCCVSLTQNHQEQQIYQKFNVERHIDKFVRLRTRNVWFIKCLFKLSRIADGEHKMSTTVLAFKIAGELCHCSVNMSRCFVLHYVCLACDPPATYSCHPSMKDNNKCRLYDFQLGKSFFI